MSSFRDILKGNKPVVVDFYADWCGPCKMMASILEELKEQFGDKITIVKIDVDIEENKSFAVKNMVQSIPTIIIFKNGVEKWRHNGVARVVELANNVEKFL